MKSLMACLLFAILIITNCYNVETASIAVKSCNLSYGKVLDQIPVLLQKKAILYLQVKEKDLVKPELKLVLKEVKDKHLKIIIWPLLESKDGPWANDHNYEKFIALMNKVVAFLEAQKITPEYLVVNMENASAQMDSVKSYLGKKDYASLVTLLLKNRNLEEFNLAVKAYKTLVDELHIKNYKVMITTYPFMIDDMQDGDPDIQDLVNVPINGINWDAYTFTPYRTAYSGDLGVDFSPFIVYNYGVAAKGLYKEKARLALGIVGPSDHGQGFKSPEDLSKDISAAKAAGIDEIDIFFLKGMINEGGVESWLGSNTDPKRPIDDVKVYAARQLVQSLDRLLDGDVSKKDVIDLIYKYEK